MPPRELLFDAHLHLVSPDEHAFPRVDPGPMPPIHYRQTGTARPVPDVDAVLSWLGQEGVAAAAVVQKRGIYGTDNRYILHCAERFPELLYPIVILAAEEAGSDHLLRRLSREHQLRGVRLTGGMEAGGGFAWLDGNQALSLWSTAADEGLCVEIMAMPFANPEGAIDVLDRLAREFGNTTLIVDHLNWPGPPRGTDLLGDGLKRLGERENIAFKITTINIDLAEDANIEPAALFAQAVSFFGSNRLMWGSDVGNTPGEYAELVQRAKDAAALLSAPDRRSVLRDTGVRLLGSGRSYPP